MAQVETKTIPFGSTVVSNGRTFEKTNNRPWLYSDGEAQWECASGYCGWSDAYVLASVREGHMHGLVEKNA